MNKYQKELAGLKTWDEVQDYKPVGRGYYFITTSGHGYLVVPKTDIYASVAKNICAYGFEGKLAYYLEEDSEYGQFIKAIA